MSKIWRAPWLKVETGEPFDAIFSSKSSNQITRMIFAHCNWHPVIIQPNVTYCHYLRCRGWGCHGKLSSCFWFFWIYTYSIKGVDSSFPEASSLSSATPFSIPSICHCVTFEIRSTTMRQHPRPWVKYSNTKLTIFCQSIYMLNSFEICMHFFRMFFSS